MTNGKKEALKSVREFKKQAQDLDKRFADIERRADEALKRQAKK